MPPFLPPRNETVFPTAGTCARAKCVRASSSSLFFLLLYLEKRCALMALDVAPVSQGGAGSSMHTTNGPHQLLKAPWCMDRKRIFTFHSSPNRASRSYAHQKASLDFLPSVLAKGQATAPSPDYSYAHLAWKCDDVWSQPPDSRDLQACIIRYSTG